MPRKTTQEERAKIVAFCIKHNYDYNDREFQYTNKVFHQKLVEAGMIQSTSRVGRRLDNAPLEG